ncbi:MAG: histidine--tRNA ligase [Kiritimatiellia bacterium]
MPDFSAPRGMRDFYPEDMVLRNRIFDSWRAAAVASGFEAYDSCVVESLELLKRKAGEEIVNQIYAFQDKAGREIALRAEMTPTLARMVAARQGSLRFPIKWFTIAQCFRYERMTRGRKREHYQLNLDIIGEESVSGEAEVIYTAIAALRNMGVPDSAYRVHLSNRALLSELLLGLKIEEKFHQGAFIALDKQGKIPREEIEQILREEGLTDEACAAAFNLMEIRSLEEAEAIVGSDSPSIRRIRDLFDLLECYGVRDQVVFDISVVRGLSYYTGIVFEAFDTQGAFRAIFGGGRYDNLLTTIGGKPTPAVGLGFGDVVIGEIIQALQLPDTRPQPENLFIGYMQEEQRKAATRLAASERAKGKIVTLQLHPQKPKAFFAAAGEAATSAVFLGPDDIASGKARIKNMKTREETEIPLV